MLRKKFFILLNFCLLISLSLRVTKDFWQICHSDDYLCSGHEKTVVGHQGFVAGQFGHSQLQSHKACDSCKTCPCEFCDMCHTCLSMKISLISSIFQLSNKYYLGPLPIHQDFLGLEKTFVQSIFRPPIILS